MSPDDISMNFSMRGRRVTVLPARGGKTNTWAARVGACEFV